MAGEEDGSRTTFRVKFDPRDPTVAGSWDKYSVTKNDEVLAVSERRDGASHTAALQLALDGAGISTELLVESVPFLAGYLVGSSEKGDLGG